MLAWRPGGPGSAASRRGGCEPFSTHSALTNNPLLHSSTCNTTQSYGQRTAVPSRPPSTVALLLELPAIANVLGWSRGSPMISGACESAHLSGLNSPRLWAFHMGCSQPARSNEGGLVKVSSHTRPPRLSA